MPAPSRHARLGVCPLFLFFFLCFCVVPLPWVGCVGGGLVFPPLPLWGGGGFLFFIFFFSAFFPRGGGGGVSFCGGVFLVWFSFFGVSLSGGGGGGVFFGGGGAFWGFVPPLFLFLAVFGGSLKRCVFAY